MSVASDIGPLTIAGHTFALQDSAGGMLNLRVALHGAPLAALARALAKLDGVRVTGGPEGFGPERCYVVHCLGFKMVLSVPDREVADFALALVSRTPQAALAVMSDLGSTLERLMSEPLPSSEPAPAKQHAIEHRFRRPGGKPLARKTKLKRKTPLARGRFRKD